MNKEHNGAAPVQKLCDMCLFTSHLSPVLKNHIDKKHLGIQKTFEYYKCDFFEKINGVKNHEHLRHKKEATQMCDVQ